MSVFLKVAAEVQHSTLPTTVTKDMGVKGAESCVCPFMTGEAKNCDWGPLAHLSNLLKGFMIILLIAPIFFFTSSSKYEI